jgi:hypothetical protein
VSQRGGPVILWMVALALATEPAVEQPMALVEGLTARIEDVEGRSLEERMIEHNQARIRQRRQGFTALVAWSGASIVSGAIGWPLSKGEWGWFHQMNLAWGLVNTAIGVPALVGALREQPGDYDLAGTIRIDRQFQTVMVFNAGLDVAYITAGVFMLERGLRDESDLLTGWGASFVVQGLWLLLFDATMAALNGRRGARFIAAPQVGRAFGITLAASW